MKQMLLIFITVITQISYAADNKVQKKAQAAQKIEQANQAKENKSEVEIKFIPSEGKTEFFAVGKPSMIKINGESEGPSGLATVNGDVVNATFVVQVDKLTTKIDLRDDHMKNKYLEVGKFPTSELKVSNLKLPQSFNQLSENEIELPFEGQFTLHGKSSLVKGTAKFKKSKNNVKGEAEFTAKVLDHLDTLPTWTVVKVAEDVRIKVQFSGSF